MLSDLQESSLVSAGDCFEHWHSSDRVMTHDSLTGLQEVANYQTFTDDYEVKPAADYILADTSVKSVTITLPLSTNGREIEVTKMASPNYVSIKTSGSDLVLGSNELRVYNYGTSLRFKAIPTGWIII